MTSSEQRIRDICVNGTPADKRSLFNFDLSMSNAKITKKFQLFSRTYYRRYFSDPDAPFHPLIIDDFLHSYRGTGNIVDAGSRGIAKTALLKLFDVFVLSNDTQAYRRYIKVETKDLTNSKQITTDVYNMLLELEKDYGELFLKEGKKKREETMGGFSMSKVVGGRKIIVKISAGTVGQDQRGHIQDAYRPDWIQFEDIEDKKSVQSAVITNGVIGQCQEAIDGLAKGGNYLVNCNYISDQGTVQWFMQKPNIKVRITPIATDVVIGKKDGRPALISGNATWPRYTLEDLQNLYNESEDFYGEYLCDPERSKDKFFDVEAIERDMVNAIDPIRENGLVKYWGEYTPHHYYGQGSDHSEGIGLDANTLAGFDFTLGKLMYTHASNELSPDLAAHEYARVGAEFGNCLYAPEINNKCGGIVITTLKGIPYSNIYRKVIQNQTIDKTTSKLGWETTGGNKNQMFLDFKRDYNDGFIIIEDIEVLKEMKAYRNSDLIEKTTGLITRHFDLLTAVVIAWQMKNHALKQQGNDVAGFYARRAVAQAPKHKGGLR